MSALVLAEVVATAEFLPVVGALERLVVCVKGAEVAFEVYLATKKYGKSGSDACGVPGSGIMPTQVWLLAESAAALYWIWLAKKTVANPIQNRSRRRHNSRHEPLSLLRLPTACPLTVLLSLTSLHLRRTRPAPG
jgi:hypothetical protein